MGGRFCVKPLNVRRAHGGIKAARQGRRRRRPCSHACSWLVQPSPQSPETACRVLGVLLCSAPCYAKLFVSRSSRADCPAAFPLYPVVLPLQVWICSDQLLDGGFVVGRRKGGIGCCMLSWRQNLTCKAWNSTVSER